MLRGRIDFAGDIRAGGKVFEFPPLGFLPPRSPCLRSCDLGQSDNKIETTNPCPYTDAYQTRAS
jgi:hypothetical protein